jgi:signal transduction histidine kinase
MEEHRIKEKKTLVIFLIVFINLFHYFPQMRFAYFNIFYRELYFLPVILAGVWFGLKGGLATSVSITVLYLPIIVINWNGFSPNDWDRVLEIFLLNTVAIVLGLISDRRKAQEIARIEAERMAREQAEDTARVKSDFLSITSHELKTPLISIIGYNDLLLDGVAGSLNEEQVDALKKIDKNSKKLLEIINSILTVTRAEMQSVELRSIDISQFIEEIKSENRNLIESSGLDFVWDIDPQLQVIQTDPEKVKIILNNLISNAVKFTERGNVVVAAHKKDKVVEICVSDTGIGIAKQDIPIIFDPFRQVESSLTREHGGVGLGLFVVKQLLDLLGGTINIESKVGNGSTFCFRIMMRQG